MSTDASYPPTIGVVLAGGLAQRMGGGDKTLRMLGGHTLLERVLERARPQCETVLLNANGDPARLARFALPVVPDGVPDHPGPLAGVLAALDWTAAHRPATQWVASLPGDGPFLPRDLLARLHATRRAAGDRALVALAASGGRRHPVIALWHVSLREALRHALVVEGLRRVGTFVERTAPAVAEWRADPVDPFFNANTDEDLQQAEALLTALAD